MKIARTPSAKPRLSLLEARDVPATLFVDDDRGLFRNAEFTSIQAAVDAADPGDRILVAPGIYQEQVTIDDDKDGLTLRSVRPFAAVIQAPAVVTGSRAVVHVAGADDVTLAGFTVTGPGGSPGNLDVGVLVNGGGSARVRDNWVKDIRDNPLSGNQTGVGIEFGGATPGSGSATGNLITDYQKGGIVVNGAGSDVDVSRNVVAGAGPTDAVAQNGIQVGFGASATVSRNLVTGNDYTGGDTFAAGIYLVDAGPTRVRGNLVVGNQLGVLVGRTSAPTLVDGNDVFGSTFAGIVVSGGSGAVVGRNLVVGTDGDGIVIAGGATGVTVDRNTVTDSAGNGVAVVGGASLNAITRNTVRRSAGFDLFDDTIGAGTAGTANQYAGNKFKTSSPAGLR